MPRERRDVEPVHDRDDVQHRVSVRKSAEAHRIHAQRRRGPDRGCLGWQTRPGDCQVSCVFGCGGETISAAATRPHSLCSLHYFTIVRSLSAPLASSK